MRDLKPSSKVPTRLLVRTSIPAYSVSYGQVKLVAQTIVVFENAKKYCVGVSQWNLLYDGRIFTRNECISLYIVHSPLLEKHFCLVEQHDYTRSVCNTSRGINSSPQSQVFPSQSTLFRYFSTSSGLLPISPHVTRYSGFLAYSATLYLCQSAQHL